MTPKEALDLTFVDPDSGDEMTIRDYFKLLLSTLMHEGEGFSGKRPFGNSGWEYNLAIPLIDAGCVPGKVSRGNEEGSVWEELGDVDRHLYNAFVQDMVDAL